MVGEENLKLNSSADNSEFVLRHIGINAKDEAAMLLSLGFSDMDSFIGKVMPEGVLQTKDCDLDLPKSETAALLSLKKIAEKNRIFRSYIGMGYYSCITPSVIKRNILQNPGWYTQYTPYQPEISQGRLESLLNFQTMICDLTGLDVANASLLDEATAAAEAMAFCDSLNNKDGSKAFFISHHCHPQVIDVVKTRAAALGLSVIVSDHQTFHFDHPVFGVLLAYPASDGTVFDYQEFVARAKASGAMVAVTADLLALCMLEAPGRLGVDVAVGSAQRFGVPLGYGGPHAAFFACKEEHKRRVPGRMVGVSKDRHGNYALRLALQTREQHIRREKATSNICTAQALLANISAMYAIYHGAEGLHQIALHCHKMASLMAGGLREMGYKLKSEDFFDTLNIVFNGDKTSSLIYSEAQKAGINLRLYPNKDLGLSFDERTTIEDVKELLLIWQKFSHKTPSLNFSKLTGHLGSRLNKKFLRQSKFLTHEVFSRYRSETELMRYIKKLENKDLSLTRAMIPLGSCTMKLNAASELEPITWPEFSDIHPFAPLDQATGYQQLFSDLTGDLAQLTGYDAVSLQPNSGASGEFAGLLAIKAFHEERGQGQRKICLIPSSAHGTNPASAAMAGYEVVVVACDEAGNIDLSDLNKKAKEHANELAALMLTYPSTHGVFETEVRQVCEVIHSFGGQVYLDGANLNALLGLCQPGKIGADVSHLNLHKTFCIPHGGGGPGVGPIAVKSHLAKYLPGHSQVAAGAGLAEGLVVSAAPWGSAGILPISWMYIKMMGASNLKKASQTAILNANYLAKRLEKGFTVLYKGENGLVAHECIIDLRGFKTTAGIEVMDVAKRLMDYGFHAPTVAFPVAGTLMIEPTESESKREIDRFCDAMLAIREEIREIEESRIDKALNPLKNAPHTEQVLLQDEWPYPYTRRKACMPDEKSMGSKYWPSVGRIDDAYGDRHFICSCPSDWQNS